MMFFHILARWARVRSVLGRRLESFFIPFHSTFSDSNTVVDNNANPSFWHSSRSMKPSRIRNPCSSPLLSMTLLAPVTARSCDPGSAVSTTPSQGLALYARCPEGPFPRRHLT
ncbi:hypothetical protein SISSUDRAFT_647507 [Sistotremastrum suecicum HHB10207 ss-3]|uniref:Uncharacterized protein n=1 Tax=Sistotremastrum suecicum HHB10207 ss-3 TaxID=1314776 RepID=A0A166EAQ0_9AGAM|nr:hypothetical protein SISSUDRAFT_647507 [Sistotremastrum suecicum HHB10207 ss-3]